MAMFGKVKDGAPPDLRVNSVIGEGTSFTGTLRVDGSILIQGEFEGTLTASESVIVGKTGNVRAGLNVRDAAVAGKVKGKIVAREKVELQTGAHLDGDVFAKSFMIEEGVYFHGNCSMGEEGTDDVGLTSTPKSPPDLGLLGQR
jgi:cytoskeletal protein CcmA (bactofilin family)